MNSDEAKFVLRAYRPDGEKSGDNPLLQEALEQAHRDPQLLQWLGRERRFDETIGAKLESIAPPMGLRQSILIGVRASQRTTRRWWRSPAMVAVAAAIVAAVGIPLALVRVETDAEQPVALRSLEDFAHLALADIGSSSHPHAESPSVIAFGERLGTHQGSLVGATDFDLSTGAFAANGCRTFFIGDREIFEVCFPRNGTWFHLFVMRGDAAGHGEGIGPADTLSVIETRGFSVATWRQAGNMYALATRAGASALRPFL